MKKTILFVLLLMGVWGQIFAQTITGIVNDENGQPMEFATISLRSLPDSTIVAAAVSDLQGQFNLALPKSKGDIVQISMLGYTTKTIPLSAFKQPQTVSMSPDSKMLKEVVVSSSLPKTKLKGDAMMTTIVGSVLEHAGNSLDVLAKVPGMITMDGKLEVIGRGEPIYYINGRKVTDNSDLRNLMSEDIKSIDVVNNPGAEYGGNVRCVVRIRTVKRQGEGFSFALTSQAKQYIYDNHETEPSWSVLDLNYRKKGLDFIGKIIYFNQWNYQISDIYGGTIVKKPDHIKENIQKGNLDYRGHNGGWQFQGGVNWQINENHSVGTKLEYGFNFLGNSTMIMDADVLEDQLKIDELYSVNDARQFNTHSINGNLYYDGNIGKLNINFNADFRTDMGDRETDISETCWTGLTNISSATDGKSSLGAGKLVLSFPVWKGMVKVGSEETYVDGKETYTITKKEIPSSKAHITENNIAGFAEYAVPFSFGQLVAGLRYEHVNFDYTNEYNPKSNLNRIHDNWFPSFNFSTKLGPVGVSLGYTNKVSRPQYGQMSSEIMYDNRYTYQTGDPTLENEVQKTLSLMANWKWLTFTGTYEVVDNFIYQNAYPYDDDGIAMIKWSNSKDKCKHLNLYINIAPMIGLWQPRYTLGVQKQYFSTTVIDPRATTGTRTLTLNDPMYFLQANNAFRFKNNWVIDLDYQYNSPFNMQNTDVTNPTHELNLAVSKSFLKHDALNIRLSWNDILNKSIHHYSTDYGNCIISQSNDRYRPCVQLRVSYRFNSANNKYKGTGAGQDAKNRM